MVVAFPLRQGYDIGQTRRVGGGPGRMKDMVECG